MMTTLEKQEDIKLERVSLEQRINRLEEEIDSLSVKLKELQERCQHTRRFKYLSMGETVESCDDCGLSL